MSVSANTTPQKPNRYRVNWSRVGFTGIFSMIFGLVWFTNWTIFMMINEPTIWDHILLNRRSVIADGRITGIYHTSIIVNRKRLFEIGVVFYDRQRRLVRAKLRSNDALFIAQLSYDRPLSIEYDPLKPVRCRFAGNGIGLFDIVTALCSLIGLTLFFTGFFRVRSRFRLLRYGTRVSAVVTHIAATSQSTKKGAIWHICFEFITAAGKTVSGSYRTTKPQEPGARIGIAYDPRSPGKNMPE